MINTIFLNIIIDTIVPNNKAEHSVMLVNLLQLTTLQSRASREKTQTVHAAHFTVSENNNNYITQYKLMYFLPLFKIQYKLLKTIVKCDDVKL
jgi:hypothetical protein